MVWLLVLLLSTQSIFSGCTAIGYHSGKNWDISKSKTTKSSCPLNDIVSGDSVTIKLKNGEIVKAKIREIKTDEHLVVKYLSAMKVIGERKRIRTITWDEIDTVSKIKISKTKTTILTSLGVLLDLMIITTIVVLRSLSGIDAGQ